MFLTQGPNLGQADYLCYGFPGASDTREAIALTIWTFVGKMMSLLLHIAYWGGQSVSLVAQSCPTLWNPMDCSTPGFPVHHQLPNSCPLSWWCHPTILSSVVSFSSCLQSFPASGSFQMSQLFTSGGQSIGVSASTSVLPMNSRVVLALFQSLLHLFNLHSNPMRLIILLSPLDRWENWVSIIYPRPYSY